MILAFDTETTGKADFRQPAGHPSQPHIVQLGAILLDSNFRVRGEINLIVKPNGYQIPAEASNIHGITQEIAEQCGVPLWCALSSFRELSERAKVFVAHNFQFDDLVMAAAFMRQYDVVDMTAHMRASSFCTMQAMTPLCKLPGKYDDYKWPRLEEAYLHAFGQKFEGAHDAMADVRACARIYQWLQQQPKGGA